MKSDLDSLMQASDVEILLIVGPGQNNPPMVYLTGGANMTEAYLVKIRGQASILFHRSIEREEAASTGLQTRNLDEYHLNDLYREFGGDWLKAIVERFRRMFEDLGIRSGRISICGQYDAGTAFSIFSMLKDSLPELDFVRELDNALLSIAMSTKDQSEIDRIRSMGRITTDVVAQVADFIMSHRVRDQVLIKPDGVPLTIKDIKRKINLWLAERGADNPEGSIFALGHDASVPHNAGNDNDLLSLGQTIIFDVFPCEPGGGYHYDFTRTWCLGYAPDSALELYQDVLDVYQKITAQLQVSTPCRLYQELACDLFASKGHPTLREDPLTQNGYVHSLGHGLGLQVHERPSFRLNSEESERLDPGVVFTIEPGLYYPDRNQGVRLEDTFYITSDGQSEVLADYPLDLVLPVN